MVGGPRRHCQEVLPATSHDLCTPRTAPPSWEGVSSSPWHQAPWCSLTLPPRGAKPQLRRVALEAIPASLLPAAGHTHSPAHGPQSQHGECGQRLSVSECLPGATLRE